MTYVCKSFGWPPFWPPPITNQALRLPKESNEFCVQFVNCIQSVKPNMMSWMFLELRDDLLHLQPKDVMMPV